MTFGASARVIASVMGLAAFTVAVIAGLAAGNTPSRILAVAIVGMILCQFIGLLVGAVGEHVVQEHLAPGRAAASQGDDAASGRSENPQVVHKR